MSDGTRLTDRQEQIVRFVETFWAEHGYGPSLSDIAGGAGLANRSSADYQVGRLVDFGVLVRDPVRARTIRVALRGESTPDACMDSDTLDVEARCANLSEGEPMARAFEPESGDA